VLGIRRHVRRGAGMIFAAFCFDGVLHDFNIVNPDTEKV
jgi:hypothetical protein